MTRTVEVSSSRRVLTVQWFPARLFAPGFSMKIEKSSIVKATFMMPVHEISLGRLKTILKSQDFTECELQVILK